MPRVDQYTDATSSQVAAHLEAKIYVEPDAETGSRDDWNSTLRGLPFPLQVLGGEEDYETASVGASRTINLGLGNYAEYTLTTDTTLAFPSVTSGTWCKFRIRTTQGGAGGWDITWPGSVAWVGVPNPDTTPGAIEDYEFESTDGGAHWRGWHLSAGLEQPVVEHLASYTAVQGDQFASHLMNVSTANAFTIPPNVFKLGAEIDVAQWGTGPTSIAGGAGVQVRAPGGGLTLPGQYSWGHLKLVKPNEWSLEANGQAAATGGGGGGSAPVVVNTAQSSSSSNTTSHSVTFPAATAGNLIVVATIGGAIGNAPSGITSGFSTARADVYGTSGTANYSGLHLYKKVATGGETTFAFTTAGAEETAIQVWEVANISAVDKSPAAVDLTASTTNVALHATTTGTLSAANEWAVFMVGAIQGSPSLTTVNQSFTLRNQSAGFWFQFSDRIVSATTALDPTLSWSPGSRAIGHVTTFQ